MRTNFTTLLLATALCSVAGYSQEANSQWKEMSGSGHTMVIDKDGYLWAAGSNQYGQLGNGICDYEGNSNLTSFEKIGEAKWKCICASSFSSAAIQEDGTLWIWGANTYGQLGQPEVSPYGGVYEPSKVNDDQWLQIKGRSSTYTAIKADGTLWVWGNNSSYSTGLGESYETVDVPTQLGTDRWIDAASGFYHSAGIKEDGTLWAWGKNDRKQIENSETAVFYEPVQIGTDNDWVELGTGVSSTTALKSDGSIWTWGSNGEGELGRESENDATPIKVMDDVKSFSMGDYHVLVIKEDGSLWAWGYNPHGEIGNGETTDIHTPVQIGSAKWQKVVAASYHSMGIQEDGSIWMWGWNRYGQLGLGDTDSRSVPTEYTDHSSVVAAVAEQNVSVYPTVASENITISSDSALKGVYVYGMNGALIAKKNVSNANETDLNVSVLGNGSYLIKVVTENGEAVKKFIKK